MNATFSTWFNKEVMPDSFYYKDPNFNIQEFLVKQKSFLSTFKVDGEDYSVFLDRICSEHNFNAKIILVNLQKEQTLVTRYSVGTTPSLNVLNRCLGFGMTDDGDMPEMYGFKLQHTKAVDWFVSRFTKLDKIPSIIVDSSSAYNIPGVKIQAVNKMTYLNYLYTPWTGTPTSIFSTGFYFDIHTKKVVDPINLRDRFNEDIPQVLHPISNPFHYDTANRELVDAEGDNVRTIKKVPGWGIHGVYAFWRIWQKFYPNDMPNVTHSEEVI